MSAALLAMGDRPIAFHPNLCRITGSLKSGLFLGQALYWQNRVPAGRDGWWWHTQDEWTEETTMTRRECDSARKALRDLGVLETKRKGMPAKTWYRVNVALIGDLLTELVEGGGAAPAGEGDEPPDNPPNKIGDNRQPGLYTRGNHSFNAEITTEKPQGGDAPNRQATSNPERPGMPADSPGLVELANYIAGVVADAQGRDGSTALVSPWLAQLRVMVRSGLSVEALRSGWEYGRAESAYRVAVMSPGGFNRHHDGLIAAALGKGSPGRSSTSACRGVAGVDCDKPATMGSSGRNTHCPDCFDRQAQIDIEQELDR